MKNKKIRNKKYQIEKTHNLRNNSSILLKETKLRILSKNLVQ